MSEAYFNQAAEKFLDKHWPEDWDEKGWDHTLSEWQAEVSAAIEDRWQEFRNATVADRAIGLVESGVVQ